MWATRFATWPLHRAIGPNVVVYCCFSFYIVFIDVLTDNWTNPSLFYSDPISSNLRLSSGETRRTMTHVNWREFQTAVAAKSDLVQDWSEIIVCDWQIALPPNCTHVERSISVGCIARKMIVMWPLSHPVKIGRWYAWSNFDLTLPATENESHFPPLAKPGRSTGHYRRDLRFIYTRTSDS